MNDMNTYTYVSDYLINLYFQLTLKYFTLLINLHGMGRDLIIPNYIFQLFNIYVAIISEIGFSKLSYKNCISKH